MMVYGKYKTKYDLMVPAYHRDNDGEYFKVKAMPDKQAKVYFKSFRTKEQEIKVISAINGDMPIEREAPLEVVYQNGKFVGYITDFAESYDLPERFDEGAAILTSPTFSFSPWMGLLFCLIIGMALSATLYLLAFDRIAALCSETVAFYNFQGIPMIVGGVLALIISSCCCKDKALIAVALAIPAFVLGAAVVFGIIFLLVKVVEFLKSIIVSVISFLIFAAVFIWGVKRILRSIGIR